MHLYIRSMQSNHIHMHSHPLLHVLYDQGSDQGLPIPFFALEITTHASNILLYPSYTANHQRPLPSLPFRTLSLFELGSLIYMLPNFINGIFHYEFENAIVTKIFLESVLLMSDCSIYPVVNLNVSNFPHSHRRTPDSDCRGTGWTSGPPTVAFQSTSRDRDEVCSGSFS